MRRCTQHSTHTDADKIPLILVACGSYSPITYLHLRMFEIALDYINEYTTGWEVVGGYFSPVSDAYAKPGLASWGHRCEMVQLATSKSDWLMVDDWEASQTKFQRTATVLDHFHAELTRHFQAHPPPLASASREESTIPRSPEKGVTASVASSATSLSGSTSGRRRRPPFQIMLLAGGDLIQSFAVPNLWRESDLNHILGEYGCVVIERTGADVNEFLLSNDVLYQHRVGVFAVCGFLLVIIY
jgi:nicotinamide mononucleotide adenylyltransferase